MVAAVQCVESAVVGAFDEDGHAVDGEAEAALPIRREKIGAIQLDAADADALDSAVHDPASVIEQCHRGLVERTLAVSARPPESGVLHVKLLLAAGRSNGGPPERGGFSIAAQCNFELVIARISYAGKLPCDGDRGATPLHIHRLGVPVNAGDARGTKPLQGHILP